MDMMSSIASMAMEMNAAKFATSYSTDMIEKNMNMQEEIAQGLLEMLPPAPPPASPHIIDIYA